MSKSGVFAHFGSKEELQHAAIEAAREIYDREVTARALEAPEGLPRVYALCDAFLDHLARGVFPGGCFFVSAAIELDAKAGPIRDHLREAYAELVDGFGAQIRRAQELGELDRDADPDQILFELDSLLLGANIAFVFFGDRAALDRARLGIRDRLERLAPAR